MKERKFTKILSYMLILMVLILALPMQTFADTTGESRLVRLDISEKIELSSTFSPDTYSYWGTVSYSVSSITLTPYAMDGAVTIHINGNEVTNGAVSMPVNLDVGSNVITVEVQSLRDTNSTRDYTYIINRQLEINNADLITLIIENAEIDQAFRSDRTSYTGKVTPSQSYVVVKPTAYENSVIIVNDTVIGSNDYLIVDLINGTNKIKIAVTAPGGKTKTYTIVINRPTPSSNANLKSVAINGKNYSESNNTYIGYVPLNTSSVNLQINAADSSSTIQLDGRNVKHGETMNLFLKEGASIRFQIVVTASDGHTTQYYNVYIVRSSTETGSSNGSSSGSSNISIDTSGAINLIDGKGATAIIEKSGSVRTYNVTLNTNDITKAINANSNAKSLVIDYSQMVSLNDKIKLTIEGNLAKLLQSKKIPVKLLASIGNVTTDLTLLNGWNSGGTITFGKDVLGATFGKEYTPETNFVEFNHSGSAVAGANPFDIEIFVFTDGELKLSNVYRYEGSSFVVVPSITGVKSKSVSGVKAGHYIIMSYKKSFTDIKNHWSFTLVDFMAKKQIISGYPDSTFRPDRYVTRAEFTSILVRAIGEDMKIVNSTDEAFSDVDVNDWYYEVVNAGWKEGLITGVSISEFKPDEHITREQMAAISVRALTRIKGISTISKAHAETILGKYTDSKDVSSWARVELATAINSKIIEGVGHNSLASQTLATRAQAATVVYKVIYETRGF